MVLGILIVCAATDESIKMKGLSWVSPQVLWLLGSYTLVFVISTPPPEAQALPARCYFWAQKMD